MRKVVPHIASSKVKLEMEDKMVIIKKTMCGCKVGGLNELHLKIKHSQQICDFKNCLMKVYMKGSTHFPSISVV